jgi:hypothetical protein
MAHLYAVTRHCFFFGGLLACQAEALAKAGRALRSSPQSGTPRVTLHRGGSAFDVRCSVFDVFLRSLRFLLLRDFDFPLLPSLDHEHEHEHEQEVSRLRHSFVIRHSSFVIFSSADLCPQNFSVSVFQLFSV